VNVAQWIIGCLLGVALVGVWADWLVRLTIDELRPRYHRTERVTL
jgi:hypothetical protein